MSSDVCGRMDKIDNSGDYGANLVGYGEDQRTCTLSESDVNRYDYWCLSSAQQHCCVRKFANWRFISRRPFMIKKDACHVVQQRIDKVRVAHGALVLLSIRLL